ncbi:MAG: hypothetical protein AB2L14_12730 [Candidatus Xenobiia bacterium LiM19]
MFWKAAPAMMLTVTKAKTTAEALKAVTTPVAATSTAAPLCLSSSLDSTLPAQP